MSEGLAGVSDEKTGTNKARPVGEWEWQVEIRVRRNGRAVWIVDDTQPEPERALWFASTNLERMMQELTGDETMADLKAMQP